MPLTVNLVFLSQFTRGEVASLTGTVGIIGTFSAGILTFFSPCVLHILPGYIAFISGSSVAELRESVFHRKVKSPGRTLIFIAGLTTILAALGGLAGAAGDLILVHRRVAEITGGSLSCSPVS